MHGPEIVIVAAVTRDGGLGRDGQLLVRIPEDLKRLKRLTIGAPVVMGRKTWQSIGRPLPGRRNVVVSRDTAFVAEGAEVVPSFDAALARLAGEPRVSVLGGAAIYAAALPVADRLELTEVDALLPADAFFPAWDRADFDAVATETHATEAGLSYRFTTYRRHPDRKDSNASP